ncbi:MAG TPA: DUF177 domain-containing protein [Nitrospirales bacterium]|nr:hypothetical protein [Nitrospiraceae bacterium]HNP29237.1 DUF177 domain-containing protein [Nitrospirales bacterium]
MSITINLLDVPPTGLQIHQEVEPSALSLSHDEGTLIGNLSCHGNLFLIGERAAHFQGKISGKVSRECVRCLDQFEEDLSLSCEVEFKKPVKAVNVIVPHRDKEKGVKGHAKSADEHATDEDVYPIVGNDIDLLPAIREQVILATPLQSLCNENCLGLCQKCGGNLNEGMCGCCTPVTSSSPVENFQETIAKKNPSKRSSVSRRGS